MSRKFLLLVTVLACAGQIITAMGADEDGPTAVIKTAQSFYDGYMRVLLNNDGDTHAYVLKSPHVTPAFKKAYQTFIKDADSDPIVCAQDYPDAGFKAGSMDFSVTTATVTLTSRDPSFKHSIKVYVKRSSGGVWQIDGTQDLRAAK